MRLGQVVIPKTYWLSLVNTTIDPTFLMVLVKTIWELIQHSRFNGFIKNEFGCGPESARDQEVQELLGARAQFPYCNPRTDPHPVRRVMLGLHLVTTLLEGSERMKDQFRAYLRREGDYGNDIIEFAEEVFRNINISDPPVCSMSEEEAEAMNGAMLMDLQAVLSVVLPGVVVEVGDVTPLQILHASRSRFVASISFTGTLA
mmetsp:Transcript_25553/g.40043  ORF Transcript_25553/g.40043 Transcript_25553/m.40043 type:complete len:202 (-) Transcript_25553:260-865(-)